MPSPEPVSATSPVNPGDILAGKYRVERVLGAGGMGVVVQATHLELDERVALKFLLPEALENAEAAARFVREARAAVKIKSEHVARVIDVGRLENGAPYMVMEFLEGADLNALIERGPLPIEDAIDYVIQACDAMAEAHAAGIVHRDLKPSNLFLTRRADGSGLIKVLDFGISKMNVPDVSAAGLTHTSAFMGSPYYMSPEQMRSARNVDHRSDVWSLGVILYELVAGTPPFVAPTLPDLLAKIMTEPPAPLREKRPDAPAELEQVIGQALVKDREGRFQSVGELAAALLSLAPRRSRHLVERIFKLSGVRSQVPSSGPLAPPTVNAPPSFAMSERAAGPTQVSAGAIGRDEVVAPTQHSAPLHPLDSTSSPAHASTHQAFANTAPSTKGKAMALGAGLGLGFLIVAGVALMITREPVKAPDVSPSAAPPALAAEASGAPEPSAPRPPEVSAQPASVAVAPEAPPAVVPGPVVSAEPPPVVSEKPASKPPSRPVTPKSDGKSAPSQAPAPKKNPLSIDLK
jgi:serine/threonine protein kinase